MARYRGTIKGNRGQASRLGTASSGLTTYANGWNVGVGVYTQDTNNDRSDRFVVTATGGSNANKREVPIATVEFDGKTGERTIVLLTSMLTLKGKADVLRD